MLPDHGRNSPEPPPLNFGFVICLVVGLAAAYGVYHVCDVYGLLP